MSGLSLVPLGPQSSGLVTGLAGRLRRTFGTEVKVLRLPLDLEAAHDVARGQYCSTLLLQQLLDARLEGRVLAVTAIDLFIPVLTYVFGEAQVNGRAAVVSIHRLRPEVYGLPQNDRLLAERLAKEAIHELGHTHGLIHCPDPGCVMRASAYVEEIDLKSARFCSDCIAQVRDGSGSASSRPGRSSSTR